MSLELRSQRVASVLVGVGVGVAEDSELGVAADQDPIGTLYQTGSPFLTHYSELNAALACGVRTNRHAQNIGPSVRRTASTTSAAKTPNGASRKPGFDSPGPNAPR
ncbi:hypothetical protein C8R47DRAFT_1079067 [Mycena vitilis]|nr:hypothetical protein C8R47DRAFT_1079067 [Mycena vitilis]